MRTKVWISSVMAAAATLALTNAFDARVTAATATANLAVSATVTNNCTIATSPVTFGAYDPVVANASANLDATGTVTVACTKGATATVGLGGGNNALGAVRRLKDAGTNYLTYELYQDSSRSTLWGDTGAALYAPGAAPNKNPRNFTVFARVAANQDVPAGDYADTVVATVNF